MTNLPKGIDLTNGSQKVFALFLLGLVLMGLWFLLPPLIVIMQNLLVAGALAAVIVFLVWNYNIIWEEFKRLSWNMTKNLISRDKVYYMYRYHDYMLNKIAKVEQGRDKVGSFKVQLQRKIVEKQASFKENMARAEAGQGAGKNGVANTSATKAVVDKKLLEGLLPRYETVEAQYKALVELHDLLVNDAEQLKYTLDAKAEEYELYKEMNETTSSVNEFLKGNTPEARMYKESLRQIEDSVSQYAANLESFERSVRPMLDAAEVDNKAAEAEGMKLIEEFKKNRMIPDFKTLAQPVINNQK
jgi:hypothetical protein